MIAAVTARPSAPPGEAEDDALGEQLADNSAGPRAEGAAEGDPAREQQAGHVGAGHQQH